MTYVADLHLHSSFACATSPSLHLPLMAHWARSKGIDLIAASDFTHPTWVDRLERSLASTGDGLFRLASDEAGNPRVIRGTEVSCIYPQDGRSHRVHLLLFAPDFATVHRPCAALAPHGSLRADGRPMLKLSAHDLLAIVLEANSRCEVIPAHAWTPWCSLYGSKGGFESLDDCFGDLAGEIHAVEIGLSSDSSMNWRVPELDERTIVSFSDAHPAPRMGRELTVFAGEHSKYRTRGGSVAMMVLLAAAVLLAALFIPYGVKLAITDFRWGFVDGSAEPKVSFFLEVAGVIGAIAVIVGLLVTRRLVLPGGIAMCRFIHCSTAGAPVRIASGPSMPHSLP